MDLYELQKKANQKVEEINLKNKKRRPFIPFCCYYRHPNCTNKELKNRKVNYRVVRRYTLEGEFVAKYHFNKRMCDIYGFKYTGILLASHPTWDTYPNKQNKSMNSIWIWEKDFSEEELKRKIEICRQAEMNMRKHSKRIARVCKDTNEILEIYDSIDSASEDENYFSARCIRRVLAGERKTYAGFKWEYYKEN